MEKFFMHNSVGIDEVGRGAIAGPVVAVAVLFHEKVTEQNLINLGINDSKKLTSKQREIIYHTLIQMKEKGLLQYNIGVVDSAIIDSTGIVCSTNQAMQKALSTINIGYHSVLVDGIINPFKGENINVQTIVKGDEKCYNIGTASIIAKVFRDKIMIELCKDKNQCYNWSKNKGYATSQHIRAIMCYGITEYHRETFCKNFIRTYV